MKRICGLGFWGTTLALAVVLLGEVGPARASSFLQEVRANFAQWDLDHDGNLSKAEIEMAVANPKMTGPAAAAAVALRRAVRNRAYELPPLTLENIAKCVPRPSDRAKLPDFDALHAGALERIQKASRELFEAGGPRLESLAQGRLGDCFCLAPLGALLYRNPQDVRNMFAVNSDGSITVTLGKRAVRVQPLSDGEIALTASDGNEGLWVKLYEKAVGEYRAPKMADKDRPTPLSVVAKGGSAGTMLAVVTGHEITRFSCSPWRDPKVDDQAKAKLLAELRERLATAMRDRRLACGGTPGGVKVPGVPGLHAYAILNYDAAKDQVLLWNPLGISFTPKGPAGLQHGYPLAHGQSSVPLTELVQFFGGFSFETQEPLKD